MRGRIGCGATWRRTGSTCIAVAALQLGLAGAIAQTKPAMPEGDRAGNPQLTQAAAPAQQPAAVGTEAGRQEQQSRTPPAAAQPPAIRELPADDVADKSRALAGDGKRSVAPPIPSRLSLYAGEAVVRRTPGALRRVAVGNGDIVSVHTVGSGEVVIIGAAPGDTNVHLWMANGSQRDIAVSVAAIKGDQLAATVRQLLGDVPGLSVRAVGSNILVSGSELDAGTAAKLATLQKAFPEILNFTGTDPVGMQPMVMMDVQIMEFDKNSVEEIGIKWDSVISGPLGGLIRDATTNPYFRVLPKGNDTFEDIKDQLPTRLPGSQGYFGIATTIGSSVNLLMNRGKAWVLASPKLSAKSGSSATFLVGGEIPIVIPSVLGQSQVEYKEYGIRLNIAPTVNARNQVSTSIMAEVSRIDPAVTVQGVPGFLTRRTETELNVHAGETIVISGLLDTTASKTVDKFPILGDIPILGRLFRSDGFRGNRTELVIFVTPRIVTPTSANNLELLEQGAQISGGLDAETSPRQDKLLERDQRRGR